MKLNFLYRQLIAFTFLAAFFALTFRKPLIILDYYSNTSQYAKNCENKARPKIHCNGKCQMMKMLQQEEKNDKELPNRIVDNRLALTLFSKSYFASIPLQEVILISSKKISSYSEGQSIDRSLDIFHPPRA